MASSAEAQRGKTGHERRDPNPMKCQAGSAHDNQCPPTSELSRPEFTLAHYRHSSPTSYYTQNLADQCCAAFTCLVKTSHSRKTAISKLLPRLSAGDIDDSIESRRAFALDNGPGRYFLDEYSLDAFSATVGEKARRPTHKASGIFWPRHLRRPSVFYGSGIAHQ